MRTCLLLVLACMGVAQAKPRPDATTSSLPDSVATMAAPAPVQSPAPTPPPTMRAVEARFAEGIALSSSESVDELRRAALLLAEVIVAGDERFAHLATARFSEVVKNLLAKDAARAADVAVAAWQSARTNPAFTKELRTVFVQLDTQGVGATTVGVCDQATEQRFEQLATIAEHVGEAKRNAYWRGARASYLRTCPTPENLEKSYGLYMGLGDEARGQATAEELGSALLARFSGNGADAWQVTDFTRATKALADAKLPAAEILKRVQGMARMAERAKQYRAAEHVYRYVGDTLNADTMKELAELAR